jgi:hypothetical protein
MIIKYHAWKPEWPSCLDHHRGRNMDHDRETRVVLFLHLKRDQTPDVYIKHPIPVKAVIQFH